MTARSSERLVNLVIALLVTPRFISRERIREMVEGYARARTDEAFQRMFERDKADLRAMGVEILTGPTDPSTAETDGYRIRPDDYFLPPISLSPEESMVAGLASSVWSEPGVAASVATALAKLRSAGERIGPEEISYLTPRVTAREAAFPVLWEGLLTRTPVGFAYHGVERLVESWKLIVRSGTWYLIGADAKRGPRVFRLSRIETAPRLVGEPGSYEMPPPALIAEVAAKLEPAEPDSAVRLAIRTGTAGGLARRGTPLDAPAPEGYEAVSVAYVRTDEIVRAICAAGPDVLVLEDGPVRDKVIAQLRAIAAGGGA